MQLSAVRVENFRAIRRAALSLDDTTVLIGENDCGRSSLLEALALVLGTNSDPDGFAFERHHVHRAAAGEEPGPIRIALSFRERRPREWSGPDFEVPRRILGRKGRGPRELAFEVRAEPASSRGGMRVDWALGAPGASSAVVNDHEALRWLRRRSPVLWILGRQPAPAARRAPAGRGGESGPLVRRVREYFHRIVEGTTLDSLGELQVGFDAARDLLARAGRRVVSGPAGHDAVLAEILGKERSFALAPRGDSLVHGTAAQRIGLLLVTGALLGAGEGEIAPGAEPIVILEDPEAHLHPMTLAAVWDLIDRIRLQKIVATHSGTLLSRAPLHAVRRLTRRGGVVTERRLESGALSRDDLRKFSYHVRARHGDASFARCWLLVEGETEFWILPELARLAGYDLAAEGVACVEFAQSGIAPLVRVAEGLGIAWHLMADGDAAGRAYARSAEFLAPDGDVASHVTLLADRDVENCLWRHGYADVYQRHAALPAEAARRAPPRRVIERAVERTSKPYLALELLEAVAAKGSPGVPPPLFDVIETCVRLAREIGG